MFNVSKFQDVLDQFALYLKERGIELTEESMNEHYLDFMKSNDAFREEVKKMSGEEIVENCGL